MRTKYDVIENGYVPADVDGNDDDDITLWRNETYMHIPPIIKFTLVKHFRS
jgi:hypothetical protein